MTTVYVIVSLIVGVLVPALARLHHLGKRVSRLADAMCKIDHKVFRLADAVCKIDHKVFRFEAVSEELAGLDVEGSVYESRASKRRLDALEQYLGIELKTNHTPRHEYHLRVEKKVKAA